MATSTAVDNQEPGVTTVDLRGDVNLLFGPSGCQVRLRVSKALLSYASGYFRALFSARFSEGNNLETGKDIALEEDEPDAVVNLCRILHMQYVWPKPMKTNELLHLAIVADKYECVEAIYLTLEALFPKETKAMSCSEVGNLVVAAYLLDHPLFLRKFTNTIMTEFSEPLSSFGLSEMGQRVPTAIWLMLESRRSEILRTLMGAISKLIKNPCGADLGRCNLVRDWFSRVNAVLKANGLDDVNPSNETIGSLLRKVDGVNVPTYSLLLSNCGAVVFGQIYHPQPVTQADFAFWVTEAKASSSALCLDCARSGGKNEGVCRVKHKRD